MEYIAPRNQTVISLSGRSVEFKKGVPAYAPPQMHAELIACGVVPADEILEEEVVGVVEPTDPREREAAVYAAFEKLSLKNSREDFTAVGVPHGAVIAKELGWTLPSKEREALWKQFKIDKSPV